EACALARKRLPGHVHIHQGFLEDFNRSDSFNCVLALGVLEHIEDIPGSLMKMRDLLTHDGVLYIEVPNCIGYPYSENVEGFRELNGGSRQTEWHLFRQSWEQHFRDAGFVIIQSLTGPSITSEFVWILKKA
ncbi:MAG TPA: class I SAM-dependent methyltransferase, partial [Anaerolineales bacterium]|nr:class I SAM-dependent methyltransferase [Anaerolineales bacterium]